MPELIVFNERDNELSCLSVENCDVIRHYLNGFLEQDIYETDSVPFQTLLSIYDNLKLLFGSKKLSQREKRALKYNYDHQPEQLEDFKSSQHTKDWLAANLPAIDQDENLRTVEILTDLYCFYQTMRFFIKRYGRHVKSIYQIDFIPD